MTTVHFFFAKVAVISPGTLARERAVYRQQTSPTVLAWPVEAFSCDFARVTYVAPLAVAMELLVPEGLSDHRTFLPFATQG